MAGLRIRSVMTGRNHFGLDIGFRLPQIAIIKISVLILLLEVIIAWVLLLELISSKDPLTDSTVRRPCC